MNPAEKYTYTTAGLGRLAQIGSIHGNQRGLLGLAVARAVALVAVTGTVAALAPMRLLTST